MFDNFRSFVNYVEVDQSDSLQTCTKFSELTFGALEIPVSGIV